MPTTLPVRPHAAELQEVGNRLARLQRLARIARRDRRVTLRMIVRARLDLWCIGRELRRLHRHRNKLR